MFKKINIADVRVGMTVYVAKSWLKTPFWFNAISIKTSTDLNALLEFKEHLHVKLDRKNISSSIKSLSLLSAVFDDIAETNLINNRKLIAAINALVASVISDPSIPEQLEKRMQEQSQLFRQSVRLLALSASFGKEIGLPLERLRLLAQSAFLLDIGMLNTPQILNSAKALTNEQRELLYQHCWDGARMVSKAGLDPKVALNILCHHEDADGSGYPRGILSGETSLEARLLRILNIYEAITGKRTHSRQQSQEKAVAELMLLAKKRKLDYRLVEKFCHFIRAYPQDTYLILYNRQVHRIIQRLDRRTLSTENLSSKKRDIIFVYEVKSVHICYSSVQNATTRFLK